MSPTIETKIYFVKMIIKKKFSSLGLISYNIICKYSLQWVGENNNKSHSLAISLNVFQIKGIFTLITLFQTFGEIINDFPHDSTFPFDKGV